MSALDYIEQSGVKGMKWGVRQDRGHVGERVKTKKLAKLDQQWQSNIYSVRGAVDIHNNVADRMNNGGLDRLNAAHPKAHLDHDTPATRAYLKAYYKLNEDFTAKAVSDVHGVSPSGGFKAHLDTSDHNQLKIVVKPVIAKHDSDPIPTLIMDILVENGKIVLTKSIKQDVSHEDRTAIFLEHHGVKGMKWGTRKDTKSRPSSSDFRKTQPFRGRPSHELTNKQIKLVNERLNLEQNYHRLNPNTATRGHNAVKGFLAAAGTAVALHKLFTSDSGKALIATGKTFVNTAKIAKVVK